MEDGFTMDLIHVDSRLSPSYNSSATVSQRVERLIKRSFARHKLLVNRIPSTDDVTSQMIGKEGEYFIKFDVGTPPRTIYALIDTGSDFTWINCDPCIGCMKKPFLTPYYNSDESLSYKGLACTPTIPCTLYEYCSPGRRGAGCIIDRSVCVNYLCNFLVGYADGSKSVGVIGSDTFTFETTTAGNMSFPLITFGCAHIQNVVKEGDGLVGLGSGSSSLISQLGTLLSAKKFSYCLIPFTDYDVLSGKISFGTHADIQGEGIVSTPMITTKSQNVFFLTVNAFSVSGDSIEGETFDVVVPQKEENFVLDSGTPLTWLPFYTYRRLRSAIIHAINSEPYMGPVAEGELDLCYYSATFNKFPNVTVYLDGGSIVLEYLNLFVDKDDGLTCMAIVEETDGGVGILGTFVQMNFRIKYDLDKKELSFKGTDCTKE